VDRACSTCGWRGDGYRVLVGKCEGETIFEKRRVMWGDHNVDLRKMCGTT
jgi:hypothetical protein